ncbi:MAG: hypothetical protein RLZZ196_2900 [Bacteroidota bacterium]|jgi:uncharacterized protein (DUF1778 family)
MNWLKYLVGISAILVAGCAAFFSVTGLGLLFSGAAASVMVMAGTLEFAKLVAATYLKQEWATIKGFNKWYLTIAVGTLMLITSAGIFGYLSNAFQQQNLSLQQIDREVAVYQTKIDQNTKQLEQLSQQANNFAQNQSAIVNKGNVNSRLLRSLDNRDKEIAKINNKISALQDSNAVANGKITEIKTKNIGLEREIGGFRFVAESFNAPLNTVVKFFIFIIVIVFDPLAVALIIAFNGLLMKKEEDEVKHFPGPIALGQQAEAKDYEAGMTDDELKGIEKEYEVYGDKKEEPILASEKDVEVFVEAIENPPAPNDEIKEAATQYNEEVKKNSNPQIDDELANLQPDYSPRPIDYDGDGSIDGYDTDGDGLINTITAHPNRAQVIRDYTPYYAQSNFDWNDRKKWINDQNAVNYWIKFIKPQQYPTDFSGKSY